MIKLEIGMTGIFLLRDEYIHGTLQHVEKTSNGFEIFTRNKSDGLEISHKMQIPGNAARHLHFIPTTMKNEHGHKQEFVALPLYTLTGQQKLEDLMKGHSKFVIYAHTVDGQELTEDNTWLYGTGIVVMAIEANQSTSFAPRIEIGQTCAMDHSHLESECLSHNIARILNKLPAGSQVEIKTDQIHDLDSMAVVDESVNNAINRHGHSNITITEPDPFVLIAQVEISTAIRWAHHALGGSKKMGVKVDYNMWIAAEELEPKISDPIEEHEIYVPQVTQSNAAE